MKKKEIAKYDYFDIVLGRKILGIVKMADKKQKSDTIRETKYVYDTKNRLVSYTDPEGRTETYTYDCNSNLTKTVDKNGNTLKNTYDNKNRLTERTAKEKKTGKETVHTYRYNAYGDVAVQDDTQFVYGDVSGQVTKETTKLTKNKDVVKNYTYDSKGNKSTFSVKAGEATKLSLSYEYDGSSRLIAVKDSEGNQAVSYAYDMLGRITRETKTGREDISYTYDANNNRKQMTIGNKTTAYQYNKNDELLRTDTLHTDTEKNDVVIYKNDKNGNQLATVNRSEIPAEAKDTSYIDVDVTLGDNQLNDNVVNHYNALNQLTETLTKNYKVSFTYDAEGLRTGKTVNGEKTVYVWDGDQVVMELSKGGAVQKRYIRGNDLVYADKGENTEKTYYVTDMHGNVVQLLDESGNVTKTYEYDSFGNEVKPEKKDENPYRYCGEYYDKETEEVYLRARYYEPGVGRFITRDTYTGESDEPLSLHLYTYCENDGVNYVDCDGNARSTPHPLPTPRPTIKPKSVPTPQPRFAYDFKINIKYGKKQREKVKEYSKRYANKSEPYNPEYRVFDSDCANFVSQCLKYAGFHETYKWNYVKRLVFIRRFDETSRAWSLAYDQYKYFSKKKFCKKKITVKINSRNKLAKKTKDVRTGDLLYWATKQRDGRIAHSTIVYSNDKENNKRVLRYSGHTKLSIDNKVGDKFIRKNNYSKIVILRLRDNINISWLY